MLCRTPRTAGDLGRKTLSRTVPSQVHDLRFIGVACPLCLAQVASNEIRQKRAVEVRLFHHDIRGRKLSPSSSRRYPACARSSRNAQTHPSPPPIGLVRRATAERSRVRSVCLPQPKCTRFMCRKTVVLKRRLRPTFPAGLSGAWRRTVQNRSAIRT